MVVVVVMLMVVTGLLTVVVATLPGWPGAWYPPVREQTLTHT